jgi:hypothetical protein
MSLQKRHSEHPIRSNRPPVTGFYSAKETGCLSQSLCIGNALLHKLSEKIDGLLADDPDTGEPCVEAIPHSSARARIKDETVAVRGLSAVGGFVPMFLNELREGFVPWVGGISREDLVEQFAQFFGRGGTKRFGGRLLPSGNNLFKTGLGLHGKLGQSQYAVVGSECQVRFAGRVVVSLVLFPPFLRALRLLSENSGLELARTESQRGESRTDRAIRVGPQADGLRPCGLCGEHVLHGY